MPLHFLGATETKAWPPQVAAARRAFGVAEAKLLIGVALTALVLVALAIRQGAQSEQRWESFAAKNHCVDTRHRNTAAGAHFGKREWLCRNGDSYFHD